MRYDVIRSSALFVAALACAACTTEERSYTNVCDTALACDDFESSAAGSKPAGALRAAEEGASLSIVDGMAYSGSRSVKISVPKGDNTFRSAMLAFDDTGKLPTPENVLYGRAMYFFESLPMTDLEWRMVVGKGMIPGKTYRSIYSYGGALPVMGPDGSFVGSEFVALYDTPDYYDDPMSSPHTNCWSHANQIAAPVGKWACIEWKFDGPNNEMQLWLDGIGVAGMDIKGQGDACSGPDGQYTWEAPAFTEIYMGWETYLPDMQDRTVWIDDVVISTQRIGCPQ